MMNGPTPYQRATRAMAWIALALALVGLALAFGATRASATTTSPDLVTLRWSLPAGGTPSHVTYPQPVGTAADCGGYWQDDTGPNDARVAAMLADGQLTQGEDYGWVKTWKFVKQPPCATATPTPTPSVTPTPTASASPSESASPTPTSSPSQSTPAPSVEPSTPAPTPTATTILPAVTVASTPPTQATTTPAPGTPELSETGANTAQGVIAAIALIALGVSMLILRRTRRG